MNDTLFYKSFLFRRITTGRDRHTDNSRGINSHFLARMLSGRARIVAEGQGEMDIEVGDVFYLPMGLRYHSYWMRDAETGKSAQWDSLGFTLLPSNADLSYAMTKMRADDVMDAYFDRIAQTTTVNAGTVGTFYLLWDHVCERLPVCREDSKVAIIREAREYIATHTDFKVSELARHCNVSESGLYALFERHAKTTPIGMKHAIRVEEAISLLQSTDLSVEEIGERLGFHNPAYFRKIFREQTGKTPTELRREGKGI